MHTIKSSKLAINFYKTQKTQCPFRQTSCVVVFFQTDQGILFFKVWAKAVGGMLQL
jgi:hypothetical protein